jgi:hypothetical protein
MRYSEILEACWSGYKQQGMKEKGDHMVPNCVPVEEAIDPLLDNSARDLLGLILMAGGAFAAGTFYSLRNRLQKYQGYQIVNALERKGVTMNRETYTKVQPVLDQFKQALKNNDGAQAKELAKRIEQMIIMGKLSASEPTATDPALAAKEKELQENLRDWFKEKWVRFGPDGKIRGACARGSDSEGKPKCLPQRKAHALGKKGRAAAAAKKRREDPNPERRGAAHNVATKVKESRGGPNCVKNEAVSEDFLNDISTEDMIAYLRKHHDTNLHQDYLDHINTFGKFVLKNIPTNTIKTELSGLDQAKVEQYKKMDFSKAPPIVMGDGYILDGYHRATVAKALGIPTIRGYVGVKGVSEGHESCPECGGAMYPDTMINEKQDACYHKVKSRYKVWPSAYASGALVRCRKVGAKNWGNKSKK